MPKTAILPDGTRVEFPDAATPEEIAEVLNARANPQANRGGMVDNLVRRAASGATMGFADEFAARMNELTGLGGSYEENLANERARDAAFYQSNPVMATAAEVGGGIASPITRAVGAAGAAANLPRYVNYATQGGVLGVLTGLGNAVEGERLQGALAGGAMGTAFGVAMPAALEAFARVGRGILNRFSAPATQASRRLATAMSRDGMTTEQAQARLMQLGPEATLADLGGNVRGLAETVAQQPGAGVKLAEQLTQRQFGQGDRIVKTALDTIGVDSLESLIAQRSAAARPLYQAAFADQRIFTNPAIERLLARPAVQQGLRRGIEIIRNEEAANPSNAWGPRLFDDLIEGADLNDPNVLLKKVPTLRLLDAAKRGLDNILQSGSDDVVNPTTGKLTEYGRSIEGLRRTLVGNLDDLTKDPKTGTSLYKQAREAWAGPSDAIEAISTINKAVDRARDGSDVTGRLFGSKEAREKLRKLFPDEDSFRRFADQIGSERVFAETNRAVSGNSRTAFRQAAQADMQNNATDAAFNVLQNPSMGNVIGQGMSAARNWVNAPPTAVADELAPVLFSSDRGVQDAALQELRRRVQLGTMVRNQSYGALLSGARVGGLLGGSNQ